MLFRFRESQAADLGILDAGRTRRPKKIFSIDSIPQCEKWRGQVLKEISRKVSRIQDPSLSDYQIRDLNDEINKLMREKHAWEVQIRNLGGPNYGARITGPRGGGGGAGGRFHDDQGHDVPGAGKGYKYYGRARELPGVKELFDAARQSHADSLNDHHHHHHQRGPAPAGDLRRFHVDASYYGYSLDEETPELLAYEASKESEAFENLAEIGMAPGVGRGKADAVPDGWEALPGDSGDGRSWELPTLEEVQDELINRRKRSLLDRFSSG